MLRSLVIVGSSLVPTLALAETVEKTFPAAELRKLSVENDHGGTKIEGADVTEVKVVAELKNWSKACKLEMKVDKDELEIDTEDESSWFGRGKDCYVNFRITVPRALPLDVESGVGDLEVGNVQTDLTFELGTGDARLTASTFGRLNGKSGTGDITAAAAIEQANLRLGTGDLNITLPTPPDRGSLTVSVGSGDTTVSMPAATKVKTDLTSGSGDVANDFGSDNNAAFTVKISAGNGDVAVRKL